MPKYRIIKIEDAGNVRYRIQKKILFWYFFCGIIENYFRHNNMALLIYRKYEFDSLEMAQYVLEKIKNPLNFTYKGNRIIRVFGDIQDGLRIKPLGDIFINKSCAKYWNDSWMYQYSESLDQLKCMIDKRTSKKKITIIIN
jgi:hypothetical protein